MPEIRSGRSGPDLNPRKKSPVNLMVGIAAVAVIAVGVGWGLTHLPGGSPGGPGGGRPGGPPGAGGRGNGRGGGPGGFGGGPGGFGGFGGGRGGFANTTVGIATANLGAIPIQLDALGTVTPPITANITSRIAGQLMAVYFTEGQMVKKGQKLAQIDPRPYQVALEQAQAQLARDQAALNQARVDLQRYQTLLAQNSIAKQQVDTQDALVKQDDATVKADQANVDNAKLNLQYTQITAPAAGRVGLRQVDVGNYINAASQTLLVLTQVDPIDVVYTIPEDNVPQITARQRSGASLPATVFDRSGGNVLANGQLSTLDNTIDTTTGTVKAKARFNNGSGTLYPNQFVNVRMLVDVLCNAIVVPSTAVRHGSQGDYVFTVSQDSTTHQNVAHQMMVTTGPGTGETVSITSGLKGGETVITDGGDRLRDGSSVNLPGQAQQGGSGFQRRPGAQGGRGGNGQFRGGQGFQGGQGFPGQGQGGQGQGGQGFRGPNGQGFGGQGGQNFRGRFGRGGQGANVAAPDKDTQSRAAGEAIPLADAAAACSTKGRGGQGFAGRNGAGNGGPGGPRFASGQGFPPGGFRRGQFGQGQGGQGPAGQGPAGQGQGGNGQGFGGGQGFPPGGFRGGQFGQGQAGQGQGGQGQGFPPGGFRGQNGQFQGGQNPGGQGFPPGGFRRRGQGQGQGQGSGQGGDQSQAQGQGG
jgi:multidrug efflux system membrane fusion protein